MPSIRIIQLEMTSFVRRALISTTVIGGVSFIAARKGLFGKTTVTLHFDDANPRVYEGFLWDTVSWSPATSLARAHTNRIRPIVFASTGQYGRLLNEKQ